MDSQDFRLVARHIHLRTSCYCFSVQAFVPALFAHLLNNSLFSLSNSDTMVFDKKHLIFSAALTFLSTCIGESNDVLTFTRKTDFNQYGSAHGVTTCVDSNDKLWVLGGRNGTSQALFRSDDYGSTFYQPLFSSTYGYFSLAETRVWYSTCHVASKYSSKWLNSTDTFYIIGGAWANETTRNGVLWTQSNALGDSNAYFVASTDYVSGYKEFTLVEDCSASLGCASTTTQKVTNLQQNIARHGHASTYDLDKYITIIGGEYTNYLGQTSYKSDVYTAFVNGSQFIQKNPGDNRLERSYHKAVTDSNKDIYVLGGYSNYDDAVTNSIVKSTDRGATWTNVITSGTSWSARHRFGAAIDKNDRFYIVGGKDANGNFLNDVWRSGDYCVSWTQLTTKNTFSARYDHSIAINPYGYRMYVVGGFDSTGAVADVYVANVLPPYEDINTDIYGVLVLLVFPIAVIVYAMRRKYLRSKEHAASAQAEIESLILLNGENSL